MSSFILLIVSIYYDLLIIFWAKAHYLNAKNPKIKNISSTFQVLAKINSIYNAMG